MKQINEVAKAEKVVAAKVETQRTQIIDFIGQALADNYAVNVAEFKRPNLAININGQQYAITISAKKEALPLDDSVAIFEPETKA